MRSSQVFKITSVIVVSTIVLTLGILLTIRSRRSNSDNKGNSTKTAERNSDVSGDWSRVEIEDGLAFYLPSVLRSAPAGPKRGYWRFRSPDMEILMNYDLMPQITACEIQQLHASAIKVEPIHIDGKEARIEQLARTAFNEDDDASLAVKGFVICVPNVGDNAHAFSVIGKYRSTEDYQTLSRIIDSIRFSK